MQLDLQGECVKKNVDIYNILTRLNIYLTQLKIKLKLSNYKIKL